MSEHIHPQAINMFELVEPVFAVTKLTIYRILLFFSS